MPLSIGDFDAFFEAVNPGKEAVNPGKRPFAWQRRLVAYLAEQRHWPSRIAAPTGSGKTAVIEAHVFALALTAGAREQDRRLPRRLALVVDRRALVDDQHAHASGLAARLRDARGGDGVLAAVADALRGLHDIGINAARADAAADTGAPIRLADPLTVVMLRGGVPPSSAWRDDPLGCMVLCATPDMWGSRLLLRGYGTARHARAREAGLLAYDSVVVVDEAHLARQLVHTARRIEALERTALHPLPAGALQVVEVTATPVAAEADASASVAVEPADLESASAADQPLALRVLRAKSLRLVEAPWPARSAGERRQLAARVAELALQAHETYGATVGCVLNTVALALEVADELRRQAQTSGQGCTLEVLVGRRRPFDLQRLRRARPGLFVPEGDERLDFVVATQTIEVGIDMSCSALVTELAPGSAIAQRAGRVNRLGTREQTEVIVVVPPADHAPLPDAPPYRASDLEAGEAWLRGRTHDPQGLAPWAVRQDPPPDQSLARTLLQRPEPWDGWLLARTTDDLVAEPDLDLWLADDLTRERDVAFVVRQGMPFDEAATVTLLRATPPRAKEAFPVPLPVAQQVLAAASGGDARPGTLAVVRGEEAMTLDGARRLRPGDVVVVPSTLACFRAGVVVEDGTETAADVLEEPTGEPGDPFVLRIAAGAPALAACPARDVSRLLRHLAEASDSYPRDGRARRQELASILREFGSTAPEADLARLHAGAARLDGPIHATDVAMGPRGADDIPEWVVVTAIDRRVLPEELRQEWSAVHRQVALDDHQAAVAARAGALGARCGLDADLVGVLDAAGRLHDAGKRDARFQAQLRVGQEEPGEGTNLLAKSGFRSAGEARAARARSGLPSGWRHEQLSAADAWRLLQGDEEARRELIVRLVGTTHGHGRTGFPHGATELVAADDPAIGSAAVLFDDGAWDALIERSHARWGIWGCAYLEALLRAADCQVSAEGG
jgi:CRISPR-associated endonuclease/helicase Cas3